MVRIKDTSILGKPSGKMKNVVYRVMNEQTFASNRPLKYNASKSKAAVFQRSKFAVTIEFAKYVNSIPVLSNIWKEARIKGTTSFNRLVKFNIKNVNDKSPAVNNIITPAGCTKNLLNFPFNDLLLNAKEKKIKLPLIIIGDETIYNHEYDLVFVFMFYQPVNKKEKFFFLDYREEDNNLTEDLTEIIIDLDSTLLKKASKYNSLVIYFSASRFIGGSLKYIWSKPYSKEFPLGKFI